MNMTNKIQKGQSDKQQKVTLTGNCEREVGRAGGYWAQRLPRVSEGVYGNLRTSLLYLDYSNLPVPLAKLVNNSFLSFTLA